jgi:hypothetical protein
MDSVLLFLSNHLQYPVYFGPYWFFVTLGEE